MADRQYDVSEEMLKLFQLKQKQRQEAKAYFQRIVTNPHRPIGEGFVFDPVMFRHNALGPYQIEHFRPNPRNFFCLCSMALIPIYAFYRVVKWEKDRRETEIRAGRVAYKDRFLKLVF